MTEFLDTLSAPSWYTAVGLKMQLLWDWIYLDVFSGNGLVCLYTLLFAVLYLSFWIPLLLLTAMDLTRKPSCLYKYKIQSDKPAPIENDRALLWKLLRLNVINMHVLYPLFILPCFPFFVYFADLGPTLPSFHVFCGHILLQLGIYEVLFFYFHRTLHYGPLFQWIHSVHHEVRCPTALVAIYSHPIEFILGTPTAPILCALCTGAHIVTIVAVVFIQTIGACHEHCGYAFPGIGSNEFHDFHHIRYDQCLSLFGFVDMLYGTDKVFKEQQANKRKLANKIL